MATQVKTSHNPGSPLTPTIAVILESGELAAWQTVPTLVASRYKEAASVQQSLKKITKHLPVADPGYGHVYWNPKTKEVWAVLSDGDDDSVHQKWHNALKAINGVRNVRTEAEYGPHGDADWIRVKTSAAGSAINIPYWAAGKVTGGPSPLSNAIVSGLLGATMGYGGGMLAENLLPAEYVPRNKLRRNLAMLGGLGGAALHVPQAFANAGMNREATGESHWLRSIMQGADAQQLAPHEQSWNNRFKAAKAALFHLPYPSETFIKAAKDFAKTAFLPSSGVFGTNGVPLQPVPVDAFNRAIWNDVHNGRQSSMATPYGTDPVRAAATSGLVTGVQQMYGNAPVLHPKHFISGLANAGLDMATAHVAGGVLGALGALTPKAQKKLQDVGLWSGMIRGVTSSVLGL